MSKLNEQIATRIKEAENKDIRGAAYIIAKCLGEATSDRDVRKYLDDVFTIQSGNGLTDEYVWSHTYIDFQGELVYQEGDMQVRAYVPGAWETPFFELLKTAKVRHEEEKEHYRLQRDYSHALADALARQNWGL